MPSAGIYLHIPFCKEKCVYCDFYSVPGRTDTIPSFVNAVITEIERCQVDTYDWGFDTIYIGGGTPSLLEPMQLERIFNVLEKHHDLNQVVEITIEANPGEAPADKLKDFHSLGINRLSIGVQSFESELLRFLTRIHSAEDVVTTFNAARRAGFTNINCDLIFNIPGQTEIIWQRDLQRIVDLAPEHLSVYSLTVEENTPLHTLVQNGEVVTIPDSVSVNMYQWTQDFLKSHDYLQYEISNFARPGKECLHNLHYWLIERYLGFGPSAHGFDGKVRCNNVRDLDQYLARIANYQSPIIARDHLSGINRTNEMVGFGIRMLKGIHLKRIPSTYREGVEKIIKTCQSKWNGCLEVQNNRLSLTKKGLVFADAIAVDLMLEK